MTMQLGPMAALPTHRRSARGPRVLVAFASRHGAAREIAATVVRCLVESEAGRSVELSAELEPVQHRPDPTDFDAVVLGSALYEGRWLEPARHYADALAPGLQSRATWLFSSGLVGRSPRLPQDDDARRIGDSIGACGHRLFRGRSERRLLSAAERSVWTTGPGMAGDFRDGRAVRAWSEEIATEVVARRAVPVAG